MDCYRFLAYFTVVRKHFGEYFNSLKLVEAGFMAHDVVSFSCFLFLLHMCLKEYATGNCLFIYLFIYLFWLWHMGSLLWHAGFLVVAFGLLSCGTRTS